MTPLGSNTREMLKTYMERIERLEEDIKAKKADLKDVYAEAKGEGFDVKILKAVVKLRASGIRGGLQARNEAHDLLETYLSALGWLPGGAEDNADEDVRASLTSEPVIDGKRRAANDVEHAEPAP